ncbi:MAG: 50S ribosomal protein L4 [Candidatus Omnitrophica bacterium]|nr:50S ribosomal protein L4 [Candidatus Omnitrophota bacterium]
MTTLPVLNQKGQKLSELTLDEKVFDGEINKPLLHQVVRMYQANLRQGTHATKTRGEVSGGGKKPWRQKGTGRARVGSIRSPLWRHGGTIFGPHPREYRYTLPKQMKQLALRSGLNAKVKDGEVVVVDKLQVATPKTKEFASALNALKVEGKALVVVDKVSEALRRSSRNMPRISLKSQQEVNAYDLLRYPKIVIEEAAFTALSKTCEGLS